MYFRNSLHHFSFLFGALCFLCSPGAIAQTQPITPQPTSASSIFIKSIQVTGSTFLNNAELAALAAPYENRQVTIAELQKLSETITQRYLDQGYLSSRAVLVDQTLTSGIVQIRILEGHLENIEIQGTLQVSQDYILSRLKLADRKPLNQSELEAQLRLLKLDPLFTQVEATLKEGNSLGSSILRVKVNEAVPWAGKLTIDNSLNPIIGEEALGFVGRTLNLTGSGDSLTLAYTRSFSGGANLANLQYQLPMNPTQGTLTARISPNQYRITHGDLKDLNIEGHSQTYDLTYRQPLIRSLREEFALSLGANYRTGQTLISNQLLNASTTTTLKFDQDYIRRDSKGFWSVRSSFDLGFSSEDRPNPFFTWSGSLQRLTTLAPHHTLMAQLNWQLTPHELPGSSQFSLGGVGNLRGYRSGIASGDNGFIFSLEDQLTLARSPSGRPSLQVVPFLDFGKVWNSGAGNRSTETQLFTSLGTSLRWAPSDRVTIQLDGALPLTTSQNRGNGLQDAGIYFSTQYSF